MSFIDDWNTAIENDPYWQFEELMDSDPKLAEETWRAMRVEVLAKNRLNAAGRKE